METRRSGSGLQVAEFPIKIVEFSLQELAMPRILGRLELLQNSLT